MPVVTKVVDNADFFSKEQAEHWEKKENSVKRGRGRPKGSTNAVKPVKPIIEGEKRSVGRPKGSKNEVEVLYRYTAPKCGCTMTSGVNPNNPYFSMQCKHGALMQYVGIKKGK